VGGHLLAEAEMVARREGLSRVIIATTNDNLPALYFYQRRGYRITEVVQGAGAQHAAAPASTGFADIPVMDELRLEKVLT
jgi:GNAT superfamily N-acetyltransferase